MVIFKTHIYVLLSEARKAKKFLVKTKYFFKLHKQKDSENQSIRQTKKSKERKMEKANDERATKVLGLYCFKL